MKPLREVINEFKSAGKAVGHFNISDSNQLNAIAAAAKETGLPVIVGLSEGEREHLSLREARALIDVFRQSGLPLYLNADHTYSAKKAQEAVDDGVDSIVVDGAKLPLAENIALVQRVVEYARGSGRDIVVEGELGYIGTSSSLHDELPEGVALENLTTVEDAKKFVGETKVDCFAPAVGNVHGMLKNAKEPRLNAGRAGQIAAAVGIPLVLHGASGNTPQDISDCIRAGVAVVHINTELRLTYRDSLKETLDTSKEIAPYKFLAPAEAKMKEFLIEKLRLFSAPL